MMKSDTIESLITAVGGGYGEDFRPEQGALRQVIIMADAKSDARCATSRKVIIMADADVDVHARWSAAST